MSRNHQININRESMPWLKRLWSVAAKARGMKLQDLIIEITNRELRGEVPELDEKLRALETLKKP